ncbi:MAG: sulfotransferase family protein [Candidatus Nitrospinota bacterium M3_3B_026]
MWFLPRYKARNSAANSTRQVNHPDFIGVGAAKCGTTWWHNLITAHPQVSALRGGIKQASFFCEYIDNIPDERLREYQALFLRPAGMIAGEWTPRYMYDKHSVDLIKKYFPDTKILVILRDPLERFRSGVNWHLVESGPGKYASLDDYLDGQYCHWWPHNIADALARSMYWYQMRHLEQVYNRANILLLQYEKCVRCPETELKKTYSFLGLDADFLPDNLDGSINASTYVYDVFTSNNLLKGVRGILKDDVTRLAREWPEIDITLWPGFSG